MLLGSLSGGISLEDILDLSPGHTMGFVLGVVGDVFMSLGMLGLSISCFFLGMCCGMWYGTFRVPFYSYCWYLLECVRRTFLHSSSWPPSFLVGFLVGGLVRPPASPASWTTGCTLVLIWQQLRVVRLVFRFAASLDLAEDLEGRAGCRLVWGLFKQCLTERIPLTKWTEIDPQFSQTPCQTHVKIILVICAHHRKNTLTRFPGG